MPSRSVASAVVRRRVTRRSAIIRRDARARGERAGRASATAAVERLVYRLQKSVTSSLLYHRIVIDARFVVDGAAASARARWNCQNSRNSPVYFLYLAMAAS